MEEALKVGARLKPHRDGSFREHSLLIFPYSSRSCSLTQAPWNSLHSHSDSANNWHSWCTDSSGTRHPVSLLLVFALIWYSKQPSVRGVLISPPFSVWELRIMEVQELAQSRTSHQVQLTSEPGSPTLAVAGSLLPSPWVSVSAPTFRKPNSEAHYLHQAFPYTSFLWASPALNFPRTSPAHPLLFPACMVIVNVHTFKFLSKH